MGDLDDSPLESPSADLIDLSFLRMTDSSSTNFAISEVVPSDDAGDSDSECSSDRESTVEETSAMRNYHQFSYSQ